MFLQLIVRVGLMLLVAITVPGSTVRSAGAPPPQTDTEQIPIFEHDPSWPKPLPNNWGVRRDVGHCGGFARSPLGPPVDHP